MIWIAASAAVIATGLSEEASACTYDLNGVGYPASCGYRGGSGGGYLAPPVDPRIGQANGFNESGRAAYARHDYDAAADFFRKAFAAYPDPAYKDNELNALSSQHFDRGLAAFDAKNWQFAIDEFQRAISLRATPEAEKNIRLARGQIAWAGYTKALAEKRYDEAELFLREADKWDPNPDLAADLRRIRLLRGKNEASAAFEAGDYARAEGYFARALALDPTSAYLNTMYADCIVHEAIRLAGHGAIREVAAMFDRAFQAYSHGVQVAGATKSLVQSFAWARQEARRTLEGLAISPSDWAEIVQAHERWAAAAGAGSGAAAELAKIKAARANETLSHGAKTAADIKAAERSFTEAMEADPTNQTARDGHAVAERQAKALRDSQDIVRGMTAPKAGRAIDQAEQARATGKANDGDSRCPWDTAAGCAPGEALPSVAEPNSQFAFAPAEKETPEQRELHPQVDAAQAEVDHLTRALGEAKDPMQHVAIKTKLAKSEQALGVVQEQYKRGKAHYIAPRGSAGAAVAGAAVPE
jgi:tetratricopeptide (TPR) repeat protein